MKNTQVVTVRQGCHRSLLLIGAFLLLPPLLASSQAAKHTAVSSSQPNKPVSAAAIQTRHDELAKTQEMLADPDPNARLAYLEEIVASGDATKIHAALQFAFHSDDPSLRSLAMRAYIGSLKELEFDIQLPPHMEDQYEALQADPDKLRDFENRYQYMSIVEHHGLHVHMTLDYAMANGTGSVWEYYKPAASTFTVSGERLFGSLELRGLSQHCGFDVKPSSNMTLKGSLTCEANGSVRFPRLYISASMF
jgi:hypothetical protein